MKFTMMFSAFRVNTLSYPCCGGDIAVLYCTVQYSVHVLTHVLVHVLIIAATDVLFSTEYSRISTCMIILLLIENS
jgi:hypothetical protein